MVKDNRLPKCTGGCPAHSTCNSGRCDCDYGFKRNWTETTGKGALSPPTLSCVDDSMVSCTKPGMGMATSTSACVNCLPGTHKPKSLRIKQSACLACQEGRFSAASAAQDCTACPLGEFRKSPGGTSCTNCSAGTFASKEGTIECTSCGLGTFSDSTGAKMCKRCPVGKISDTVG